MNYFSKTRFYLNTSNILFLMLFMYFPIFGQVEKENQYSNEFQINKTVGKKSALEFDLGQSFTSGLNETNPLYKSSQLSFLTWYHYFANKKWKFSGATGYFFNKDVPEINQNELPEIRISVQAIYYFSRSIDYTLSNKFLIEDRILIEDKNIGIVYRFRESIKLIYALSTIKTGKGSLYGIAAEEVFFKTGGNITGQQFFDRNRLTLGCGYSFSDHIQMELSYLNEYLPRTTNDLMYNIISTSIIFNDIITGMKKKNGSVPVY